MDNRYEKGDLVTLKDVFRNKAPISVKKPIGIVVDVITRSTQNSDWDKLLVYIDGWIDSFSPRTLETVEKENKKSAE
mgnify:CR=1 FL=1|tara:strand:+ start:4885 stop:5115 length:231 start_codon:yes stop_codon:yes gene_type:complete